MTNYGNILFNLTWNSTNPTAGPSTWALNGSDMQIDDDANQSTEPQIDTLSPVYINAAENYFTWGTGIEICQTATCDSPIKNETLPTHWHIYPPLGLAAGIYTNTILYTTYT